MITHKDTAIITGGAQGIGLACAKRLAANGSKLVLLDTDEAALTQAKDQLPNVPLRLLSVDITNYEAVQNAIKDIEQDFGSITQMINSAGISGPNALVEDYPLRDWQQIIDINLTGSFHMLKAVLPGMKSRGYGRIVMVASVAGKEGNPNASAYSASKAAVMAITKSLGKELAGKNIAVNCVTPAAAKTRIFDQMKHEHIDYMLSKIPRGRFLELDEAAAMIVWLSSAENSFTTGGVFDLSGGRATY